MLGIKPATLYTYVSRGLLHPLRHAHRKANRYLLEELQSLKVRSSVRQGSGPVAAAAMRWGQPVIETSITEIDEDGPRYRGFLATDLVRHPARFENTAELLWSGLQTDSPQTWPVENMKVDVARALEAVLQQGFVRPRMMRVFSIVATVLGDGTLEQELRMGSTERLSRQMLFAFTGACGLLGPRGVYLQPQVEQSLALHVMEAMGVTKAPALEHAINTALILSADHELSSSTFSARIAASTGATLHACIVAALATHQGAALAGGADAAEDLIESLHSNADLKSRLAEAELKGQRLPGFGLPIYPNGDPRAALMIKLAQQTAPGSAQADLALRFVEGVNERLGLHPNIEMGLVVLCNAWRMPARSACALWGIGRTAGWIAHTLEQRLAGFTIRPRGLYQVSR
jgi:citrate synthase